MKNWKKAVTFGITSACILSLSALNPAPSKAAASERDPVIFIHGAGGIGHSFTIIENRLVKNGWDRDELYAIEMKDKTGNNRTNGKQLAEFVEKVKQETGKSKVDIVGHSAGGMNALHYAANLDGAENVEDIVTLGAPNRLAASEAPEQVSYTSIYSKTDFIVNNRLSKLDGAKNIQISGIDHFGFLYSSKVQPLIEEGLNGGGE
ncbi:esterase/lipase family protein [Metabacillus sp. 84]|uniref:esterase/lipase family protein n=1 Tax=unclassified Metabacillus TaxID=2675274 RepID=UPI003CF1DD78